MHNTIPLLFFSSSLHLGTLSVNFLVFYMAAKYFFNVNKLVINHSPNMTFGLFNFSLIMPQLIALYT